MDEKNTKLPGPHHGTRPLRGLDHVEGLPFEPGPMVSGEMEPEAEPKERLAAAAPSASPQPGRFGRIFPRSHYNPTKQAIHDLAETMREPNNPSGDNPEIPIGLTFLGQFIDHDLTLDATTVFEKQQDPRAVTDFRTANFDLDNLYGSGPGVSRHMYDVTPPDDKNPVKLLLDPGRPFDLPRNTQNTAIIGDLRNDENFLVSQLHLAFIKFHNAIVDLLRASGGSRYTGPHGNMMLFNDASTTARWHYQWILVHEFLPKIVGQQVVHEVLTHGRKLYDWRRSGARYPFMPVEFSTAAYRLGHTMLRQDYVVNDTITKDLFMLPVFGNPRINSAAEKLDFKKFFDFPGSPPAQRSRKFDAKITLPVFDLPFIDKTQDPPASLAERNMLRGLLFRVPSGQEAAHQMKAKGINVQAHSNADLGIDHIQGLGGHAPLFYYIMKESELPPANGLHLGPVGGRIVAEVFLGLLSDIKGNYLHDQKNWKPTLPSAQSGTFTMADLLTFANA